MPNDWKRKMHLKGCGIALDHANPREASDRVSVYIDFPQLDKGDLNTIVGALLTEVYLRTAFGTFANPEGPPELGLARIMISIETKAETPYQLYKEIENGLECLNDRILAEEEGVCFLGPVVEGSMHLEWISGGH